MLSVKREKASVVTAAIAIECDSETKSVSKVNANQHVRPKTRDDMHRVVQVRAAELDVCINATKGVGKVAGLSERDSACVVPVKSEPTSAISGNTCQ